MKNTTITTILEDVNNMNIADNLMTEALKALEAGNMKDCIKYSTEVLAISTGIEQRLAAMYLISMTKQTSEQTASSLKAAYNAGLKDSLIKQNNQAHQNLYKICEEFDASMKRIQAKL